MRPLGWFISFVGRFAASFHPRALPPMLRQSYARELVSWWFLPMMLGAVEGGVFGNIIKKLFTGSAGVETWELNYVVAIVMAGPAFANISSFVWANLAHGRRKIRFIVGLQIATAVMVTAIGFAPENRFGLYMLATLVVAARVCWSGVITIRTTVWRNNYPRADRATVAGRLATIQSALLALIGWAFGVAMDYDTRAFHVLFPVVAVLGFIGIWIYSGVRLRGQKRLARAERHGDRADRPSINPLAIIGVLRADPMYRRFMICMFIFGLGNLMLTPPLTVFLHETFKVSYAQGIVITSSIPMAMMPLAIPMWARLLRRVHIVQFRAVHSWAFVATSICMLLGAVLGQIIWFYLAAVSMGIAFAGGVLAWNLGHQDFAPPRKETQYMGVHVTLTGVRGLLAPFLAIGIYEGLNRWHPGAGGWVFAVSLGLNLVGAIGFLALGRTVLQGESEPEPVA